MQFLYSVAKAYVDNEVDNLCDYCFVFPNKRSITFFTHAFEKIAEQKRMVALMPECITISDFFSSFSNLVEADRMELIFILYNAYCEVILDQAKKLGKKGVDVEEAQIDFNRFQFWADVIVSDFNDVDRYNVDARQIFRNVESLKEISANYLTPEQLDVIRRYWNEESVPEPAKEFWNHILRPDRKNDKSKGTTSFVKLWQVMYEIYVKFREMLEKEGLCYSGMLYRKALEAVKSMGAEDFPFKRYVFVGFNMLSTTERKIFESLLNKTLDDGSRLADFYWDNASPAFSIRGNAAGAAINLLAKDFPSIYPCVEQISTWPQIHIVGVPSRMAQAKLVGEIVGDLLPGPHPSEITMRRTAVVLPQEGLCMPVLHSLPPRVSPVNITMGYPLRETTVASLLRDIVSMQLRARSGKSARTFYYEDVERVLTNPLLRNISPKSAFAALREISVKRLYNIPEQFFDADEYKIFKPVFTVTSDKLDSEAVLSYLQNLLLWLRKNIACDIPEPDPDDKDDDAVNPLRLDYALLDSFLDAIDHLRFLRDKYLDGRGRVYMADSTVFHLVEKMVGGVKVNFEGMPLKGLQVMGVLEARALDFENVIIPSMNEKIFPRKHFSKSFIPNALRVAYGMSTTEHQELIYAYHFYRMISRTRKVYLLYDARTSGVSSGDMSRYLYQLIYIYRPKGLSKCVKSFVLSSNEPSPLSVAKTPEIMEKLEAFRSKENPRYLSASTINRYIECPLQFYFTAVKGLYPEDEKFRFIDEGTYGTIVHDVLQWLYEEKKGPDAADVVITKDDIDGMIKAKVNLQRLIRRSINKNFLNRGDDDDTELAGEPLIIGNAIVRFVVKMLELEKNIAPFRFIAGELEEKNMMTIDDGSGLGPVSFNLTVRIDRLDRVTDANGNELLRVVDYKTGSDPVSAASVDSLFAEIGSAKRSKAMLQLLLYCNAYGQFNNTDEPIQPLIYSFREMMKNRLKPLSINKQTVDDYHDFNPEFLPRIAAVIREIFNPDVPFTNPSDDHACRYCKFVELCEKKGRDF